MFSDTNNSAPGTVFQHGDLTEPAKEPAPADPIHITHTNKYSEKSDPPLVDIKVTNPVTYLKKWVNKILKNEGITLKLSIKPLTAVALVLALTAAGGTGFSVAKIFFPNSSPILRREVSFQGLLQKTETGGYILTLPDNSLYTLKFSSPVFQTKLPDFINTQVMIKGNLGREPNIITVKEVLSLVK